MATDTKALETLVEIVTREIVSAYAESDIQPIGKSGEFCKVEYVDDLRVTTCFNEIGQVINAGAERSDRRNSRIAGRGSS